MSIIFKCDKCGFGDTTYKSVRPDKWGYPRGWDLCPICFDEYLELEELATKEHQQTVNKWFKERK